MITTNDLAKLKAFFLINMIDKGWFRFTVDAVLALVNLVLIYFKVAFALHGFFTIVVLAVAAILNFMSKVNYEYPPVSVWFAIKRWLK